jgi:hypothetical protein
MDRRTAEFISAAALKTKRRVACPDGEYRVWRSGAGAEIWMHYPKRRSRPSRGPAKPDASEARRPFDPIDDLMGLSVVHAGASSVRMRLARALRVSQDNPLDGVCIATLPSRREGEKAIAFTFELLGFGNERTAAGSDARVQLTGLAQKVWAFRNEAEYLANTPSRRLIGRGAIADVNAGELPDVPLIYRPKPGTLWLVTGEVRRSIRLVNPVTSQPYYWIDLATDRGNIDLVTSPGVIEGDISDGHTLQAVVAMAGRVLERLG